MQNTTKGRDDGGFPGLVCRHWGWFSAITLAAAALRLFFILRFPVITPDSLVYGDLAKNWLLHGVYGLSSPLGPEPSLIRLPGYPAFLTTLFAIVGVDHYGAARFVQLFVDIGSCFVIADLARRLLGGAGHRLRGRRAARWAFALAAVCPFLANYTAVPLTETWSVFFSALALDCAVAAYDRTCVALVFDPRTPVEDPGRKMSQYLAWAGCGLAIAAAIYFRPDGGMLLAAIGGYLLVRCLWTRDLRLFCAAVVLSVCALAPLLPWAVRNWRAFHQFQPLAPVTAADPGEFFSYGFAQWQKTWMAEYASNEDIGFRVDGEPISVADLPARAFDSAEQRQRTEALFAAYNESLAITPELDAQFAELARERIRNSPLRYYLRLPLLRAADMWLRPRTELLPLNVHWWWIREDTRDSLCSLLLAAINAAYLLAAVLGAWRWSILRSAAPLAAFVLVRTVLVTALGMVEDRYMLECYPVVIAFASAALAGIAAPIKMKSRAESRLKALGSRR